MREILGNGTLFTQANMLFGSIADHWTLHLLDLDHGMLLAILPPGAFIGLGLIIAGMNAIKIRQKNKQVTSIAVQDIGILQH
jgi:electron transport complex protein RnfE